MSLSFDESIHYETSESDGDAQTKLLSKLELVDFKKKSLLTVVLSIIVNWIRRNFKMAVLYVHQRQLNNAMNDISEILGALSNMLTGSYYPLRLKRKTG